MATSKFYDALETREPAAREAALMQALAGQVRHARACTDAFAELLAAAPDRVDSRAALAALPVTRKHELLARQQRRTLSPSLDCGKNEQDEDQGNAQGDHALADSFQGGFTYSVGFSG